MALATAGGLDWLEDSRFAPRGHNRLVLAMIDGLIAAGGVTKPSLDAVAFSAGPGSFTGVRIGASVAQGIAAGLDIPVFPVPTAEALALRMAALGLAASGDEQDIRRRSRVGWCYQARFAFTDGGVRCVTPDRLVELGSEPCDDERVAASARAVGEAALRQPHRGVAADRALPVYIDGDTPWRPSR